MNIKYTIIIPTLNGSKYVLFALNSILYSRRKDFEVVVSDNHSDDGTFDLLSNIKDTRVRLIRPPTKLPMAGHYEFALSNAVGEWISILGDDDAILPYFFDKLDYLIDKYPGTNIISSSRAYYFWPNCEDLYGSTVVNYRGNNCEKLRSTKFDLFLALLGIKSCFDLPMLYTTGVVRASLLKEITKKSSGNFYKSIIPDIYSSVAICLSSSNYLKVELPLFWVGTSNKSMARSDRIYRDSEPFEGKEDRVNYNAPSKISSKISYDLHSAGISNLYIYECLLQCPFSPKHIHTSFIRLLVNAGILSDIKRRHSNKIVSLLNYLIIDCAKNKINTTQVYIAGHIILFLYYILLSFSYIVAGFKKIGLFRDQYLLQSNDRSVYKDINDASMAVMKILIK